MRPTPIAGFRLRAALAAAAIPLVVSLAVRAQQAPTPPRNVIPMAASTLALHPDDHYGEHVSMVASVEAVLSPTTFSVDQDKAKTTGREVLVIVPTMNGTVAPGMYLTIVGEVVRFDPDDIARRVKGYTLDLPAEAIEKFRGKPAVLATSVVTPDLSDVGKRPPPPLTPEELAFDKTMKNVEAATPALRQGLYASSVETSKQHAATLKQSFIEAQLFFKNRGTSDAAGWAGDALKLIATIETSVASAKWEDAKTSAASLQQLCSTCHAAHRERMEDGTFRVRGSR